MSDVLPDPLTQAMVDLTGYPKMPLAFRRLFASDTWALGTAEEKVACLHLWCESWHQKPSGSLPNDDRLLAHLSAAGARWRRLKPHCMRGWVLCNDGRWYHPVVGEIAREAWDNMLIKSAQGKAGAAARWGRGNAEATGELWPGQCVGNANEVKVSKGKAGGKPPTPFELPSWVPPDVWQAFVEHRVRLKKPMTEYAKHLVVLELAKLHKLGNDAAAVLQQSMRKGWQDVFGLKDTNGGPAGGRNQQVVEAFLGADHATSKH